MEAKNGILVNRTLLNNGLKYERVDFNKIMYETYPILRLEDQGQIHPKTVHKAETSKCVC